MHLSILPSLVASSIAFVPQRKVIYAFKTVFVATSDDTNLELIEVVICGMLFFSVSFSLHP